LKNEGKTDIKPIDTSDSTDSETYSKRRRIKTKHELDKMKSNSNSSLLTENAGNLDLSVKSGHQTMNGASVEMKSPRVTASVNKELPGNRNNSVPMSTTQTSHNANVANVNTSDHNRLQNSYNSVNGTHIQGHGLSGPDVKNAHPTQPLTNGTENSEKTGLSRAVSLSSHSSSQSDLDREVVEGAVVEKKGHVVYHWAMIQLCMSPEMEKFMQDIVSIS